MTRTKLLRGFLKTNKNLLILFFAFSAFLLHGCNQNRSREGFNLQRFEVKNIQLDGIISSFVDSMRQECDMSDYVPLLVLHDYDSIPHFYFTEAKKESVSPNYIFMRNNRIVGYIESGGIDVIVLTTINVIYDCEEVYYDFILPTMETKQFEFVYFPDDMYWITEEGYPQPPVFFDPSYKVYWYKDDEVVLKSPSPY